MKKFFVIAAIACTLAFAMPFMVQGQQGGGKGGWGGKGGNKIKGPADNNKAGKGGPGQDQGDDWRKRAEEEIGWGEDGTEERIQPGDTVKDDEKEARLESEADKLGLEDKKLRKEFIKIAKAAWVKAEKEDARWSKVHTRVKKDEKALEKETTKHKEELDKAWKDGDDTLIKKEIISEEQLEAFKKNTDDLRAETATDKSLRQDEIRAQRVKELEERAAEWRKAQGGGAGGPDAGNDGPTKEKKEDEE